MQKQISVVILVRNHREHIGPCLYTVSWADEVVIVNDGSDDGTIDIARTYPNVRIVHRALNHDWSAQMNFGLAQASGGWVLQLDVDERVPGALAAELQDLIRMPEVHGVAFRVLGDFLGCLVGNQRFSPYAVRMVRRGSAKFENRRVHALLRVQGRVVRASNPLVHLGPFPTVESFWRKNALYARLEAQSHTERGERLISDAPWSMFKQCLLKPLGVFLHKYWVQGFWRRGTVGFHYALLRAIGYYMVYLSAWEMSREERHDLQAYCAMHDIPYLDVPIENPNSQR